MPNKKTQQDVNQIIMNRGKKDQAARLEKFIEGFFGRQDHTDYDQLGPEVVANLAWEAWELIRQRQPKESKIQIYELKLPLEAGGNRLVINALNQDMPFLVDSLLGLLNSLNLRPRVLLRPIFRVQRSSEGNIEEILEPSAVLENVSQESLIHCEISNAYTPETLKKLREEIPRVFSDVRLAVDAWRPIKDKVLEAQTSFSHTIRGFSAAQLEETQDFIEWLASDHFTFLGYREYEVIEKKEDIKVQVKKDSLLGLLSDPEKWDLGLFNIGDAVPAKLLKRIFQDHPQVVSKTLRLSTVHRAVPFDSIIFKIFDADGNIVGLRQFLGLFTSMAYSSSSRDIPVLRQKVLRVVDRAGYSPLWHDGKAMIHILDSLPRDELFQASEKDLLAICKKVMAIQEQPKIALFIRQDSFDRYLSCLVYVPRDRFEYSLIEKIEKIIQEDLGSKVNLVSAQYGNLNFARIHYMVRNEEKINIEYDVASLEKKLVQATYSWKDNLRTELISQFGEWDGSKLFQKYANTFKKGYPEDYSAKEAVIDIQYIEATYKTGTLGVRIYRDVGAKDTTLKIKLYNIGASIALSDVVPTLEDMDLNVISENPFCIAQDNAAVPIWIHDFETKSSGDCRIDIPAIEEKFLELFERVHLGHAERDGFNRLVIRAGLDWSECAMIRAYCKYMRQLHIQFSQEYMESTLVRNPIISRLLRDLFVAKFDPKTGKKEEKIEAVTDKIYQALNQVENIDEDRILRRYTNLILATVRTNYYQSSSKGDVKSYLSFKFESQKIEELPSPKPLFEIFVYSPRFEAVHLRGGKIARGGIRWSDRREDFRTEILGLLKAQMVKNSVIVPQGAKGGFILKSAIEKMTRDEFLNEGVECYKLMIRALLELTDNLVTGATIQPQDTVCWDEADPYLVVAADKGTATFSDTANSISEQKKFWLGDAFASGGSYGYDHKKMGITARGAWESVKRHFCEMGIDPNTAEISVVGVGDMAGDVFGNGMLMSKTIRLFAAFNHKHIFLDPNPDAALSFKERKRLFENRLGWDGYDPELISKGGGVFERKTKLIKLTPQIKKILEIKENALSPSMLIQAILRAQVDLIWLGGIGTFVKSRAESHADAGDRTNDDIRINASELCCKVLAEGANLGVTQKARIEFAHSGGALNTDAIDNSAGVDCSDHEVNIKILLQEAISRGSLNMPERNKLLVAMSDQVSELVLRTNYEQNLALSLIQGQGSKAFDSLANFMRTLEKQGKLDRALESLPDDSAILEYQASQTNFCRPELSVLMPYAKNSLYNIIIKTDLPDEPRLLNLLMAYFPTQIQESYKPYITIHPLRREIIATMLVNSVVNRMGPTFILDVHQRLGTSYEDIFKAYYAAIEIFGLDAVWKEVDGLNHAVSARNKVIVYIHLIILMRRATTWLIRNSGGPIVIPDLVKRYKPCVDELHQKLDSCLVQENKQRLQNESGVYESLGVSNAFAKKLSRLELVTTSPDIVQISYKTNAPVVDVASLYFAVGERFSLSRLRALVNSYVASNSLQRMASASIMEEFYLYQGTLTKKIHDYLMHEKLSHLKADNAVEAWIENYSQHVSILDQYMSDPNVMSNPDLALFTLVRRELHFMCE
ncbi:MAG: NAD-glutamate dehydrogenase [Alphaproteobacteria bacterium]|nr:NAD-glutamate dehydrogenase [Alphaproteobacteria bacterium]